MQTRAFPTEPKSYASRATRSWRTIGVAIALAAPAGAATTVVEDDDLGHYEGVITVTGTRAEGRVATDTPAPVDIISEEAIRDTGATETGKILQILAPSFNFSSTTISDGTDIIRPATLRALGPDQVLVLVNGKRRHQQALLNVQQTVARGSAGYDINAIPAAAIKRIEVLRDGAAAQYGSDAIAGVINIILKDQADSGDLSMTVGQHYEGDGEVFRSAVNVGVGLADRGTFNVTAEFRDRGETNRAGVDSLRVDPPAVTQRIGDADSENVALWFNSDYTAGTGHFYAFGGYTHRSGNSSGFFRSAGDGRTIPELYPEGFLPTLITEPTDTSLTAGYQGVLAGAWTYDLGMNWGQSEFKFREENTANVSYYYEPSGAGIFGESATEADTGTLTNEQFSLSLDFTRSFNDGGIGEGPMHLAGGIEWRRESYRIEAGDPISYQYGRSNDRSIAILDQTGSIAQPGTQGFPGWSPTEAVDGDRDNLALYLDLEAELTDKFHAGAALRFEDYSDFGSTVNGKVSARYDFNEQAALRSTFSTGFRAPGVQQSFYSQRSTNLNAAGVLTDTLTARQGGDVTRAFGIPELTEETSKNYTAGLVLQPNDNLRITADLYRIDIDDRIIFSSNIQPEDAAACGGAGGCPIRDILDPFGVGQVLFFTNAIDTETTGFDLVAQQSLEIADETNLTLEAALHLNDTEVTARRSSSSILPADVLFDDAQITLIERGQPGERATLAATVDRGRFNGNVRFNYYGEVSGEGFTPGFAQTWSGKWLTDLALSYQFESSLRLTIGGTNIFDVFPDEWDTDQADPFPQLGFVYGWETLPFGINGGYYYASASYNFDF